MRVWVSVGLLVTLGLAGCSEETGPAETPDDFEQGFDDLDVDPDRGAVRGVVLTETIVPIAGATVRLTPSDLTTTSNDDGLFVFADLEPGTYFVEASKPGFDTTQQGVTVAAGVDRPDVVKLILPADPTSQPFTELQQWEGFLQCGAGLGPVGSTNPCAFTGSDNVHGFAVQRPPDVVQVEMIWEGTNAFGDTLSVGLLRPGTISNFAGADSGSPAIFQVNQTKLIDEMGDEFEEYTVRVFPGTEGGSTVSVVVEQRFTVFTTNFYGFEPDEGWAFVVDGTHPVPS